MQKQTTPNTPIVFPTFRRETLLWKFLVNLLAVSGALAVVPFPLFWLALLDVQDVLPVFIFSASFGALAGLSWLALFFYERPIKRK
tara:strand:+ start:280 stop:537 length:258 start_codon:yes stop_codon:yes gene_type:complete